MQLLVVVYHYIDDENKYKSGIYPTSVERLSAQLDAITKNWQFIGESDLLAAIKKKRPLPTKSCLITFDDCLRSQYETALPFLRSREIPAIFFAPTRHLLENKAYIAHKVHWLLSQIPVAELLAVMEDIYAGITGKNMDWRQMDIIKITNWYRYDNEETAKFKYFLNHFLEEVLVDKIIGEMFAKYYQATEQDFCESVYASADQVKALESNDLFAIGMHTHSHLNINKETSENISTDIEKNYQVLTQDLGLKRINGISYPFGSVTEEAFASKIKSTARELDLIYGFTTKKEINQDLNSPMLLSRFGTNDITGGKRPIFQV